MAGEQAVSPLHVLGKDEQTQRAGKLQRVTSSCVQGACSLMMFDEPGELNGPIELALGPSAAYSPRSRLTFLRKLLMRHVQVVRCGSLDWDRVLLPQTAVRWIEYQAVAEGACEHAAPNLSAALVRFPCVSERRVSGLGHIFVLALLLNNLKHQPTSVAFYTLPTMSKLCLQHVPK
ncbi:hypothetical protein VTI28DRAFT_5189 [Corynascus sepedonium]